MSTIQQDKHKETTMLSWPMRTKETGANRGSQCCLRGRIPLMWLRCYQGSIPVGPLSNELNEPSKV